MERDNLDKTATGVLLNVLGAKTLLGQKLWEGYIFAEEGNLLVDSKQVAIRILDNPNSPFHLRVAAFLFAEAYKKVVKIMS